ncbi:hypothetical protein C2G38_2192636 [Gigaspora rosea]|uniref:Uncharacterized protein n=1 Tax=Gigaspora rosea TaxID=44941 RepID=A0A397UYU8_9GLOM|nr:hypothetical protein C2G38_2192636 [Gigaspora rosea]
MLKSKSDRIFGNLPYVTPEDKNSEKGSSTKDLCENFEKWQSDESILLELNESKSFLEIIKKSYYENMLKMEATRKPEASVVQDNWQWVPLVQEILVEVFLFGKNIKTISTISYSRLESVFLEFWTKSGKTGVPPPKDRHCCSYPNREEGMQVDKQERTRNETWRSGVGKSVEIKF